MYHTSYYTRGSVKAVIGAIAAILVAGGIIAATVAFVGNEGTTTTTSSTQGLTQENTLQEQQQQQQSTAGTERDTVPPFTLTTLSGESVSLSGSAGTVRVINSWASWCPFCVDELPDFARLQEAFPERVTVIAINRAEPAARAKEFADRVGVTGRMTLLRDPKDSFYQSIGGFAMPETLFVNEDGEIVVHKRGPMEFAEMREKVREVVNTN